MRLRRMIAVLALAMAGSQPATAATTVFASSVYAFTGNVVGAANALGVADGTNAAILRVPGGSSLTLRMLRTVTGANTVFFGSISPSNANVRVLVGEVIGGVAVFSTSVPLSGASGGGFTMDLTALCKSVSATGCSLLRFAVNGAPGGRFTLDGVLGTTPEPSTWALMIIGFAGVARRLKDLRKSAGRMSRAAA